MNPMTNQHSGSCLCGTVRFKIEGDFERFFLCHCSYCRKDTGSAHAANLFSTSAKLEWLAGNEKTALYRLGETRHVKCFCSICGSALPYAAGKMLVVPAGSLDSEVSIKPNSHIFCASRANWDDALENIPKVDNYPS